jgi:hypothetical protein
MGRSLILRRTPPFPATGASREPGRCKHESSSEPAGGGATGVGQLEPGGDEGRAWLLHRQRNGDRGAAESTNASVRDSRFRATASERFA